MAAKRTRASTSSSSSVSLSYAKQLHESNNTDHPPRKRITSSTHKKEVDKGDDLSPPQIHDEYIVEFKTSNIHILTSIVQKLKNPVKEISLEFREEGLIIEAAEEGSPIQITGQINRSQLTAYQYDNHVRLIEVQQLLDVLRAVDKSHTLSMFVERRDPLHIWIVMESSHSSWRTRLETLVNDKVGDIAELNDKLSNNGGKGIFNLENYSQHLCIPSVRLGKALANFKNHNVDKIYIDAVDNKLTITQSQAGQPFSIFTLLGIEKHRKGEKKRKRISIHEHPSAPQVYHGEFNIKVLTQCTSKSNDRVSEYTDIYLQNDEPLVMLFTVADKGYLMFRIADCHHQVNGAGQLKNAHTFSNIKDVESSVSVLAQQTKDKLMRALKGQSVQKVTQD